MTLYLLLQPLRPLANTSNVWDVIVTIQRPFRMLQSNFNTIQFDVSHRKIIMRNQKPHLLITEQFSNLK
jgi:hypothetical protein